MDLDSATLPMPATPAMSCASPTSTTPPLLLASLSPVRAGILRSQGIAFTQIESGFDEESLAISDPKCFAYMACIKKLESTLFVLAQENKLEDALRGGILCADSVVSVDGKLLRKAKNKQEAINMLEFQSTKRVSILTALAYKSQRGSFTDMSACHLELGRFDEAHLREYVDSGLWRGKAGCVMVEGFHRRYIRTQVGLESSALGLSIEKLLVFLGLL